MIDQLVELVFLPLVFTSSLLTGKKGNTELRINHTQEEKSSLVSDIMIHRYCCYIVSLHHATLEYLQVLLTFNDTY